MSEANFNWLVKQARNKKIRLILRQIQHDWKLARKGEVIKGNYFISLHLGKHIIWMRKYSSPTSVDIYTEIFKEKGHTILPQFSGKNDKVVFDIGANEGFYTLKIKQNNPNAKIVSVEANPSVFQILKKNVSGNKLKDVILVNNAVTSKAKKVKFEFVKEVGAIGSLNMSLQKRLWLKKDRIQKVIVDGITLEKLCDDNKIKNIGLLKLDVEGAELDILKNSKNLLPNIQKIVVEYHTKEIKENIKKFLKTNNFKLLLEEKNSIHCGDLYFVRKQPN